MDRSEFLAAFKHESEEYLKTLNQGLVQLEKTPEDTQLLTELFRAARTLKGCSRMMGYEKICKVAHKLEDLFGYLKEGKLVFQPETADAVFKVLDHLSHAVENVCQGQAESLDPEKVVKALESCLKGETSPPQQVTATKEPVEPPKEEVCEAQAETVQTAEAPPDHEPQKTEQEFLQVPLTRINHLLNLMGEVVVHKVKSSYKVNMFRKLSKEFSSSEKMLYDLKGKVKEAMGISDQMLQHDGKVLRASQEMSKAADVMNHLHDIEICHSELRQKMQGLFDEIQAETFYLNPVIEELQQKMKEIRMLPCAFIFEGFPRMVRDLARDQNKKIEFRLEGQETELDKKVLERIKGPLVHMLRNAVDHGIESAEARKAAGKPSKAMISLSAKQEGGHVVICVKDDGKGMDVQEIKQAAVKKGILDLSEAEHMSDEEALNLIFSPGFTTAKMITDVSGRGVGLDAVREEIEQLKGSLFVSSEKGKGTEIRIELPLTVAIMKVLIVEASGMRWAFPIVSIEETLRVSTNSLKSLQNQMMIRYHDEDIPGVFLSKLLRVSNSNGNGLHDREDYTVLIVQTLKKRIGFIVDRLVGEDEVFIKGLGSHLSKVEGVGGAAVLATGEVLVVLDAVGLIQQTSHSHPAVRPRKRDVATSKKRILVVEDSLTTRELEKTILENSGYEVETAIDGLDAMRKLSDSLFNAIISDVQMPRMDGFELCRHVKNQEKIKELPFIFVTSLATDEEKRKGMDVGAQAYILKSQFDQGNLIEILERLIL